MEGEASVEKDGDNIKDEIQKMENGSSRLDCTVHGLVAVSAMKQALEQEDGKRRSDYMAAVREGMLRVVKISLHGSISDTQDVWSELIDNLGGTSAETLTELRIQGGGVISLPERSHGLVRTFIHSEQTCYTILKYSLCVPAIYAVSASFLHSENWTCAAAMGCCTCPGGH